MKIRGEGRVLVMNLLRHIDILDRTKALKNAHRLKGLFLTIGAEKLALLLEVIEERILSDIKTADIRRLRSIDADIEEFVQILEVNFRTGQTESELRY
jgi:hypothetical protein